MIQAHIVYVYFHHLQFASIRRDRLFFFLDFFRLKQFYFLVLVPELSQLPLFDAVSRIYLSEKWVRRAIPRSIYLIG